MAKEWTDRAQWPAVAITGTGAVTGLGVGTTALVDGWLAGESGIRDGRSTCDDFEPEAFLSRSETSRTDRYAHLVIAGVTSALAEAGWGAEAPYPAERIACLIGTGVGGISTLEEQYRSMRAAGAPLSPDTVPMMMPNSAAGFLAIRHGWHGPSFSVGAACATGGNAIGEAMRMIQVGDVDAVVTGASDAGITELGYGAFAAMEALSPTGRSLPFDARRDGFVMGEGAGVLVLERAELARARGAEILGEVLGYGTTTDAYHITAPDPEARGATRAIEMALADAGLEPSQVDYVNAHGTGTELNDRSETIALKRALGEVAKDVPVSSTKSVIGHLLGAAGVVEAVATVHALRRGMLPPTTGYEVAEEGMDLDYVPHARPIEVEGRPLVALSNAFGFGGHNVVICLSARRAG